MTDQKHIDEVTGVETTGHVWDGDIRELNKPLPRWWLYTFYASIVWSIGYWVLYPAWPTANGYTKGVLGYSQRAQVTKELKDAAAAQSKYRDALLATPMDKIKDNEDLNRFATASGQAAFQTNCAPCHGRGAQGFPGYPNLNDDEWIWGGSVDAIYHTIRFGIRNGDPEARDSAMPRFGEDQILDKAQISDVADYVLSLSGASHDAEAVARGKTIFSEQCAACHQDSGVGNRDLGAPNLANAIWLYGNDKEDVMTTIRTGRGGKMPPWHTRLDDATLRALAVYVHGLGGGE